MVLVCYKLSSNFPPVERFVLVQQIRRAATSAHLNLAEGASRKSLTERKRFYEISRSSLVEIDTIFDLAFDLGYATQEEMKTEGDLIVRMFKMLTALINQGKE